MGTAESVPEGVKAALEKIRKQSVKDSDSGTAVNYDSAWVDKELDGMFDETELG